MVQQQLARSPGSGWVGGFVGLFLSGEVGPIEFSSMPFLFVFFLAFIYVGSASLKVSKKQKPKY